MNEDSIRLALAHRGSGPLYRDAAEGLGALIEAGGLRDGERLPPERELARLGGLSRVTLRKAVRLLVDRGLLAQRQGSGTYAVAPAMAPAERGPVLSLGEELRRRGLAGRCVWLARQAGAATAAEAEGLGLEPGAAVTRLSRLWLANERPLALQRTSLPAAVLPDPATVGPSLYAALDRAGARPVRAVQRVGAVTLTPRAAETLGTLAAAAALKTVRTGYDAQGRAVELTETLFRADAWEVVTETG